MKKRSIHLQLCSNYIFKGCPNQDKAYLNGEAVPTESDVYDKFAFKELNAIPEDKELYLEIGSGKGKFITDMARLNPDKYYLACEGGVNINVRILQKANEQALANLKVITEYIRVPSLWFPDESLDGIYLNFCDPWPKDRHANRRLTYRKMLEGYKQIAKAGAFLQFKTDNDALFDWSLEEFKAAGLEQTEISRDLWSSEFAEGNITTEYEEKFGQTGKNINYIKLKLK